jgi:hypothetical protein
MSSLPEKLAVIASAEIRDSVSDFPGVSERDFRDGVSEIEG